MCPPSRRILPFLLTNTKEESPTSIQEIELELSEEKEFSKKVI